MSVKESFYVILYIVILARIVLESLGIIVSNDLLLFAFYIFVYINGQAYLPNCRSPPIITSTCDLWWLEVFLWIKKIMNLRKNII